ncbi:MAG: hypothetical protein AAGF67_03095, partial [Verrucomicrobiota bacterium]
WQGREAWIVLALLGAWILVCGLVSLVRRPGVMDALLTLDQEGGWKDRFSSALEFSRMEGRTEAEDLHIRRSSEHVEGALQDLPRAIPLPSLRFSWIVPVLVVLFAIVPLGRITPEAGDLLLTDEMRTTAEEQAEELRKSALQMEGVDSLSEEEKEELENLRVQVDEVADTLADAEGLTAGEMLDALEARARAAERLAEKMGLGDEAWASEEMIAEMSVHPDTADLALSVKDKAAEPAADEAEKLQKILERPEITRDTVDRFTDALDQIMAAAQEEDYEKPVGERVGNASTKMLDKQPLTAAREFEELAKHFRFLLSREEAREKLEELANSLREAGSEVSGSELEQMERIASEGRSGEGGPEGLQSINEGAIPEDLQKMLAPQMTQSGANQNSPQPAGSQGEGQNGDSKTMAPIPGEQSEGNESAPDEGQSLAMEAPIPGEPQNNESGQGQTGAGAGESMSADEGGGMLSAPIPGEDPGESAQQGGDIAMAGGSGSQMGQGGDQAGTGTAPLIDSESDALEAARDSEVVAQINDDGDSTVRAIEGRARSEEASRSRQEIMTDFLAAEEQALDGKEIPLSRREHVIRYFSEIRRQFEQSEESP